MLLTIGIISLLFLLIPSSTELFAQTTTNPEVLQEGSAQNQELKQQVTDTAQEASMPIDAVTIGSVVAAAGGLLLKDRKDKKDLETKLTAQEMEVKRKEEELKQKNQEITEIVMALEITNYKLFNSAYLYPKLSFKDILDLKATNNPLEKNTLGEEYAIDINKLAKYTVVNYHVPMPNMSIPTAQVIQASTMKEGVKETMTKSIATVPEPTSSEIDTSSTETTTTT
jgi:hypothetical protein